MIKPPIRFSGRTHLLVDGKELGPVAGLVIAESLYEPGIMLVHCDQAWNVLGASSFSSIAEAASRAERTYRGVSRAWVAVKVSKADAVAYERKTWKGYECSFCGRISPQFNSSVAKGKATICDLCIQEFQRELHGEAD